MTKLYRLIAEHCPDRVEYKTLGEVCTKIYSGKNKLRSDSGQYKIYGSTGIIGYSDTYVYEQDAVLVARVGANCGYVHLATGCYDVSDNTLIIETCEDMYDLKYAYYQLTNMNLNQYAKGGGQPLITAGQLKAFQIPVPQLPIQHEIVRILDNFTELTAELTARKKQYNYYRDELLTFGDDVPMVALGAIATITRGSGLPKSDFAESGVPCIHYGQIYTYYGTFATQTKSFVTPKIAAGLKTVSKGDIIIAVTSENIEDVCKGVAWLGDDDIVTGGHTAIVKHNQNPKYIAYWLQSNNFFEQKRKIAHGTKVIEVTPRKLEDIIISVPSLEEQERIVTILDRFDVLTTDISSGLPAEIAARQKQYEYYRDKLLTFKEPAS